MLLKFAQKLKQWIAREIWFDNSTNGFVSNNTQSAIEEIYITGGVSAPPGFTWGRSGNVNINTWLLNDTVPSNLTGRTFPLYNGKLIEFGISNGNANTFTIELYEHDGTTYTLLTTVSLTAQRSKVVDYPTVGVGSISITKGKELAVKIGSGSSRNPDVYIMAKGTTSP